MRLAAWQESLVPLLGINWPTMQAGNALPCVPCRFFVVVEGNQLLEITLFGHASLFRRFDLGIMRRSFFGADFDSLTFLNAAACHRKTDS